MSPRPRARTAQAPSPTHAHEDRCELALLVIDMLSGWDFPEAEDLLREALPIAPRIARLAARCREAGVPVIYANDNRGRWRSDLRQVVRAASAGESDDADAPGRPITRALAPHDEDYVVLKPRASAFHATPLELLLHHLGTRRLIVTGVSADQCVLMTAHDAHMREFEVAVPRDCIASLTAQRTQRAIEHLDQALRVPTTPAARVRLPRRAPPGPHRSP